MQVAWRHVNIGFLAITRSRSSSARKYAMAASVGRTGWIKQSSRRRTEGRPNGDDVKAWAVFRKLDWDLSCPGCRMLVRQNDDQCSYSVTAPSECALSGTGVGFAALSPSNSMLAAV